MRILRDLEKSLKKKNQKMQGNLEKNYLCGSYDMTEPRGQNTGKRFLIVINMKNQKGVQNVNSYYIQQSPV